jgi:hypothetical protein
MKPVTTMAAPLGTTNQTTESPNGLREEIRHRAHELYEQRGRVDGVAWDDWFQAVLLLIAIWYRAREAGLPRRRLNRAACCSEGRLNSLTIECGAETQRSANASVALSVKRFLRTHPNTGEAAHPRPAFLTPGTQARFASQ